MLLKCNKSKQKVFGKKVSKMPLKKSVKDVIKPLRRSLKNDNNKVWCKESCKSEVCSLAK